MICVNDLFEVPTVGQGNGCYLATVVSVQDPLNLSRVQIKIFNVNYPTEQDAPVWARVAVPFAGSGYGAFFIPDVGEEVLVNFVNGDTRFPIIVGSLWHGGATPSETLGNGGSTVDRWTLVGKNGTRIAIIEEAPGQETISFTTPNGVKGKLTDEGGGKIELEAAQTTLTMDLQGVAISTQAKVTVNATQIDVTAGQVTVNAGLSRFNGVVQCDVIQATTVIGSTYTPGAGNVW
jgi:uncharacterized protein involved in type VI secretion and phage assembly